MNRLRVSVLITAVAALAALGGAFTLSTGIAQAASSQFRTAPIGPATWYAPSLAIDSGGGEHLAVTTAAVSNGALLYADNSTGTWGLPVQVDQEGGAPRVMLDGSGNPHILYVKYESSTSSDVLYHAWRTGDTWSTESTHLRVPYDIPGWGDTNQTAIDSAGHIFLAVPQTPEGRSCSAMSVITNASGSWGILSSPWPTKLVSPCWILGLTIDAADVLHVVYRAAYDSDPSPLVYTATYAAGSWTGPTPAPPLNDLTGLFGKVAVDPSGFLHLFTYSSDERGIEYASNETGSWVVTDFSLKAAQLDVIDDRAGTIHVCVGDPAGHASLYFSGTTGHWSTVVTISSIAWPPHMAVDPQGRAHIVTDVWSPLSSSAQVYESVENPPSTYMPLTPNRVLDSKDDQGINGALAPYTAASFQVTKLLPADPGRNVPSSATAVTGVLSVSDATYKGWVALTPEPDNAPTTSTINFPAADARSTGVTAPLGSGGKLSVTYGAPATANGVPNSVQVIFDVTGYFIAGTSGSTYFSLTPNRILDSRRTGSGHTNTGLSGVFTTGVARTFQVTGRTTSASTNVPAGAVAVTGVLTVTGQTDPGFLTLGPDPLATPDTASLFFPKGDNRATGLTVKLGAGGTLSVTYTTTGTNPAASTNVIFDVNGYFIAGTSGAMYIPVTPNRLVDTRSKLGITTGAVPNHSARTFVVWNRIVSDPSKNIPTGAVAITGTLTVTAQTYPGWLALTPTPNNNPATSNLNFPKGDNRATGVTVPLSSAGKLSVTYGAISGATTAVVFDVTGYFVN